MWRTSFLTGLMLGMTTAGWPVFSYGQTASTAKVCGFLPTAELEAHFGTKASVIRGSIPRRCRCVRPIFMTASMELI